MKRKFVDSTRDRRLLLAIITSKEFLARAKGVIDLELIETHSPVFKQIANWGLRYYEEYGAPAGKHIEEIYEAWVETQGEDSELVDSVHDLLETLSSQFDEIPSLNIPFLLDELSDWISKLRLKRLQSELDLLLLKGDVRKAEEVVSQHKTISMGEEASFDPILDNEVWDTIFLSQPESLIQFSGPAGKFFNSALTRDALIGIQAPEKTGKTWWCVEFMFRALRHRRKVALFEVGDLSKSQILTRLAIRLASRPMWPSQCGSIDYPIKIVHEEDTYYLEMKTLEVPNPIDPQSVKAGRKKFQRGCGLSSQVSYARNSVHPNSSINVQGIGNILDQWASEFDFIPDVIIIDYADILAPEDPKEREFRHKFNDSWKALRRLSQERHALVIAPTQANALSYGGGLQTMKNFSEDKRKLGHVTGMLALNQTAEEKEFGGMRLNWIVLRESPYDVRRPLYVGTCFKLGRSICCASF